MKYRLISLLIVFMSSASNAGTMDGYVDHLLVHWDGNDLMKFDVSLTGTASGQPTDCQGSTFGEFTGYLDKDAGKAQYSMLLAAATSKQKVRLEGQNSCFGPREVVRNVLFLFE